MSESVRTIVTCYLIYVDWKPVAILKDKAQADFVKAKAQEKGKESFVKDMRLTDERMNEIGINIFNRLKDFPQKYIDNIISIRNKLILMTMELAEKSNVESDIAWEKIREQCDEPIKNMSYTEFSQWTKDVAQYVLIKR